MMGPVTDSKRDPRTDPRPGDILRCKHAIKGAERHVWSVVGDLVRFIVWGGIRRRQRIAKWREQCADANVLKVAP